MDKNVVILGDCLEVMRDIPDKSVDMILCDLPYGSLSCKWDVIIPFDPLWEQYKRIIKDNCAIVLFGQEPFSSKLRLSNLQDYKYDWIWDKKIPSGMCNARIQPMRQTESISVFISGNSFYHPIMQPRDVPIKSGGMAQSMSGGTVGLSKLNQKTYTEKYPTTLLSFDKVRRGSLHPTQKPVSLCEYLIKTYTNEGDTVLDNCAGSGTTGVACQNTKRSYILIEKEAKYVDIINKRLADNVQDYI
jgi:site-specific DNA-methyltransferase (adenine-specific)